MHKNSRKRTVADRCLSRLVGLCVPNLKETWLRGRYLGPMGFGGQIHLTPALVFTPWQKSCLATIDELGITTHTTFIGIEVWRCIVGISFGVSTQVLPNNSGQTRPENT